MRNNHSLLTLCLAFGALVFWSAPLAAHHKPGHQKPGASGAYSGGLNSLNSGRVYVKRQGPPPWAPAHGYRAKYEYTKGGRVHEFIPADLVRIPDFGLGRCDRETLGAVLGAAAGGAAGSQFGKGDGKILTSVGGAIVGALVGGAIGRAMDQVDQNCVGQILERAPTGSPVAWRDPDGATQYHVTPTRTYQARDGRYCREFQTEVLIGGKLQSAYGTACRQPDGSWERVS